LCNLSGGLGIACLCGLGHLGQCLGQLHIPRLCSPGGHLRQSAGGQLPIGDPHPGKLLGQPLQRLGRL
jgi:hypothetical protein